jgi:hypothetical protein
MQNFGEEIFSAIGLWKFCINRYSLRIPPGMRSLSFPPYYSPILFVRAITAIYYVNDIGGNGAHK